jgi:hypothetical protein
MLRNIALATLLTLHSAALAACSDEPDVIQPKPGGSGGGGGGGSSGSKAGSGGASGGHAGTGAAGTTEQDAGNENDAG